MSGNVLLLETVLMNSFVGEDSWVYVKVGDSYVRKKGRDLQAGDLVVVNNEGIHKELKDVEPVLEQSMRYLVAKRILHETNRNGQDIKRFRILLLRGLADASTQNLEQRIMMEGDDFSATDYSSFKERVMQYVFGVEESAVRNWLNGGTLAPRDWRNFGRLSPINKEFESIDRSFGQDTGYYASYQLFTGLRRTIMAYIAKRTGKIKESVTETDVTDYPHMSGKYAKEIELVVGHFMQEVDRTRSATRITRIKPLEITREERKSYERPDPHLKKGVVVGELELTLMDMNQIRQELYLLDNALYDAFNNYSLNRIQKGGITIESPAMLTALSVYLTTRTIKVSPVEKVILEQNLTALMETSRKTRQQLLDGLGRHYLEFLVELQEGEVDRILGVEPDTIAHLIDLANRYRSAMPKSYFDMKVYNVKRRFHETEIGYMAGAPRQQKREKQREALRLLQRHLAIERYLIDTYGIQPINKRFFMAFLTEGMSIEESGGVRRLPTLQLINRRMQYQAEGVKFFTKQDIMPVFARLGILDAAKLYDQKNFV